ncbi:MAG TPA: sterol desaturase family protein [Reyranella sp.]|nr:sterol desaturase family protein [Reyranella sp.]
MEFYLTFDQLLGRVESRPVYLIVIATVIFSVIAEALLLFRRDGKYPWKDASLSVCMTIGHFVTQAAAQGAVFGIVAAVVYDYRLMTVPLSWAHWPNIVLLFLLVDLVFYIEHRCSHRVNLLWCSHSVHHSGERMLTTTAFRLPWTPILSGIFWFYLVLVWLGFDPVWVYGMSSVNLAYQFFVHTELVPHIRWLEWVLDTPSAHRVHHASNPEYIDKNYGGTLMIWDHLFGTYQPELPDVQIKYGLVHKRSHPDNPFVVAYEGLWDLIKGVFRPGSVRERFARVFGPP